MELRGEIEGHIARTEAQYEKIKSCQEQIEFLAKNQQEMKNIEGILNRQEEEARIVSVTQKINKVVLKKKKDIQSTKAVIKELREEMRRLKSMNSLLNDFFKKTQLR